MAIPEVSKRTIQVGVDVLGGISCQGEPKISALTVPQWDTYNRITAQINQASDFKRYFLSGTVFFDGDGTGRIMLRPVQCMYPEQIDIPEQGTIPIEDLNFDADFVKVKIREWLKSSEYRDRLARELMSVSDSVVNATFLDFGLRKFIIDSISDTIRKEGGMIKVEHLPF